MHCLLHYFRKLIRRFRSFPHWLKDLYQLVTYLNFLELIPTFFAIILTPRHFFRRLPLILQNRRLIYRTPIKFFANSAFLFVAVFFFRHPELAVNINEGFAVWYMLILIPIVPIFMIALAIVLLIAYQLPRLIWTSTPFPQPNPYPFWLVLSYKTYLHLSWHRFAWGLFYISIYFIVSWQVAQLIMGYSFVVMNSFLNEIQTERGIVELIIAIIFIVLASLAVHWLVFRPYGEMLRMSLRHPLPSLFKADVYDIEDIISDFCTEIERKQISIQSIENLFLALDVPLIQLAGNQRIQDSDFRNIGNINCLKKMRSKVYLESFQINKLREEVSKLSDLPTELLSQFEELLSTMFQLASPHDVENTHRWRKRGQFTH